MSRRTPPWKAALWGGICCNLPDLDVFISHGDPIRDVTYHRGATHSLFYLTLISPLLAAKGATFAHLLSGNASPTGC